MTARNESTRARIVKYLSETEATANEISAALNIQRRSVTLALQDLTGIYKNGFRGGRPVYTSKNPAAGRVLPQKYKYVWRDMEPADYDIHAHGRMAVGGR